MDVGGSSHSGVLVRRRPRRRGFLLGTGAAGIAALGAGWAMDEGLLPGGEGLRAVLGRNDGGTPIPDVPRGQLVSGSFESPARLGRSTGWTICWPDGVEQGARLPVLVMLHGHASDHTAVFEGLGMDRFLGQAVADGLRPFAIASVWGGRDYWQAAPDGSDAGRMVAEEFVPLLAEHGLDTDRLSVGGWSMGGYGALRLAGQRMLPARSVATFAPALHEAPTDEVLHFPDRLRGIPVQIGCGRGDMFYDIDRRYVAALRAHGVHPDWHTAPGGHTQKFWRTFVPRLLQFTGRYLNA